MARENGINEMVGRMGHKSAVANNDQIVNGIAAGVKSAVADAMMEVYMATGKGDADGHPYLINLTVKTEDNETLARAVEKGMFSRNSRYKPSPVY